MRAALGWIFRPLPNTDDPEVRKRVVYVMLALNLLMFLALTVAVDYSARTNARLRVQERFERNLCVASSDGRRIGNARAAALERVLRGRADPALLAVVGRPVPLLDCPTGRELAAAPH